MKLFPLFKSECAKWIAFFGLKQYSVHFASELLDDGIAASVDADTPCGIVKVYLTNATEELELDASKIQRIAFHEMCHVLLARFAYLARCRYCDAKDLHDEEEAIVRTLENTVFPLLEKRVK